MLRAPKEPPKTRTEAAIAVAQAKAELWRRGILTWKLHEDQLATYQQMMGSSAPRWVLEIARRWGKTWLLCCIALEICLRKPKTRVVYGAPTLKNLAEFILPNLEAIQDDAPPECRGRFRSDSGHWALPNGSYIHLFGADDKAAANRGRGPEAAAAFFDEGGFCGVLDYVLRSVFRPQLLHTRGRMFLGSTPAEEPDHPFTVIAERAEANGNYTRRTIHDNPRLSEEQIRIFIEEDAKEEGLSAEDYQLSDEFRREYLAERVVNKLLIVVPEWEAKRSKCIEAIHRPEFFLGTTTLDFGGADPHAAVLGYWHFDLAKWVVEHELLLREGENTAELAEAIMAKEREAWGVTRFDGTLRGAREDPSEGLLRNLPDWMSDILSSDAPEQPFERWADNDLALVRDLYELHKLAFIPTSKDDKELAVNNLRVSIRAEQLVLHPRCVHTDRHLRSTTWENNRRKAYARRAGEHGDLLDCLVYQGRNLNKKNPVPPGWGVVHGMRDRRPRPVSDAQALADFLKGGKT